METGRKRALQFAAGILIAIVTAWLTFRNTDWEQLGTLLGGAGWGYALAVIPALAVSYVFRIFRWVTLLSPVGRVSRTTAAPPLITGFMLNSLLPGRLGEFARSALLSRKTRIPFPSSFATVVVARLFDGLALTGLTLIVMGAMWSSLSQPVRNGLLAAGVGYIGVLFMLIALRKWHERTVSFVVRPLEKFGLAGFATAVRKSLMEFAQGLDVLRSPSELVRVSLHTAMVWLSLCLSVIPVFIALGIDWQWYYPPLVLVLAGFGMLIPTPAGTGTVHYALGVLFPAITGIDEPTAKAMAIFFHATQFLPVIVAGLAVSKGHLKLEEPREPRIQP